MIKKNRLHFIEKRHKTLISCEISFFLLTDIFCSQYVGRKLLFLNSSSSLLTKINIKMSSELVERKKFLKNSSSVIWLVVEKEKKHDKDLLSIYKQTLSFSTFDCLVLPCSLPGCSSWSLIFFSGLLRTSPFDVLIDYFQCHIVNRLLLQKMFH